MKATDKSGTSFLITEICRKYWKNVLLNEWIISKLYIYD